MNYQEIVNNPSSDVELICIKGYSGVYQLGIGKFIPYKYKKGEILPRKLIFLKETHWKLNK